MSERERLLEKIASALQTYGERRDWEKMRPDEMAEVALRVIEQAGPIEGDPSRLARAPEGERDPMQGNRGYMS